jgi:hypothetical protein
MTPTGEANERLAVFLCRPQDVAVVTMQPAQQYWYLHALDNPVIEYRRPYNSQEIIRAGRMYVDDGFLESERHLTNRPFSEWVEHLFKAAKRSLVRDKKLDAYLGEEALDIHARGLKRLTLL